MPDQIEKPMNDPEVALSAMASSTSQDDSQENSLELKQEDNSSITLSTQDNENHSISETRGLEPMEAPKNIEQLQDVVLEIDSQNNPSAKENSSPGNAENDAAQGRPRRRTVKAVSYTEKQESDIPSMVTEKVESKRARRKVSPSDSNYSPHSSSSLTSTKTGSYYDVEDVVPINYQPPIRSDDDFNELIDLKTAKIDANETTLTLKTGETIKKGDCIYMICEPPSDPFYIAKVIGFTKKDASVTTRKASNYSFSVCWFYRPRDLNRRTADSRLVYASLHRDTCPIASYRGKVTMMHKSEIDDLDEYKKMPDSFYFDKLYDRYMIKMYDMIPTNKLVHLPQNYYTALNKRFEFVFVEVGKADELLSSPKNCEKCLQWCSSSDSIPCSGCQKSYHLLCLDPPILTKPKRGFAWYCAPCNKRLEEKLAENRGNMLESAQPSQIMKAEAAERRRTTSVETEDDEIKNEDTIDDSEVDSGSLSYEQAAKKFLEADRNISFKRRREVEEWPYRYLGVHAKFEDALDLQDRPYARAASRLGTKYQCSSVVEWYGHPVKYYDVEDAQSGNGSKKSKKYNNRAKKSSTPVQTESEAYLEQKFPLPEEFKDTKVKDYPGWLQPKPKGYIERGGDETSTLLWKMPPKDFMPEEEAGHMVEKFIEDCAGVAERLKLTSTTTPNFIDAILLILMNNNYDTNKSMYEVQNLTRESLKEPTFSPEEVQRFEDSVRIHGSELYPVYQDVKTQPSAMVVRFYYLWKKTKMGHEIWDNFPGRAKNRMKVTDDDSFDLEDPQDDGCYSNSKIMKSNFKFKCMYCESDHSPEWFKAPGALKNEDEHMHEGLCYRCAKLWRKYAAKWENPVELLKSQDKKNGGYASKKKVEFALIQEAENVLKARDNYLSNPKKKSEKLKKFKTIDSDYDYSFFTSIRETKRVSKKIAKQEPVDATAASSKPKQSPKSNIKKEKKPEGLQPKKQTKRAKKETSTSEKKVADTEVPQVKKRKYNKKSKTENGLTFIVESSGTSNNVTSENRSKEHKLNISAPPTYEYGRVSQLKTELETTMNQLLENTKSGLFNAFLDMKLRERIESLEKELSKFKDIQSPKSIKSKPSETGYSETPKTDNNKKHAKRRLYLSKTSVPGAGVFETPPNQLPAELEANDSTDLSTNGAKKFVFHMYDRNGKGGGYNILDTEFQSQPNLPPVVLNSITVSPKEKLEASEIVTQQQLANVKPTKKSKLIFKNASSGSALHSSLTDPEVVALKPAQEAMNVQPTNNSRALSLVDSKDEVAKKMMARYTSKFDIFNPLISDDSSFSPIYQLRSSSKELSLLWKQYQASKKSKGKLAKVFQPLFSADSRPCCVCRELGDIKNMLICSNCGLNVHSTCYGVKLDSDITKIASEYNWHCDPCSNDLHPVASTQYACLLCNSRESNMDQAIKGDPSAIPDALKRTCEGRWCHITCALISDEIKFASHSLQPVFGAHAVGVKNIFQVCEICSTYGGAIPQCEFCKRKAHVTCALDYDWKIAFKLTPIFESAKGDIVKMKDTGAVGKINPIIYCDAHERTDQQCDFSNIYDSNELATRSNLANDEYFTLLQLYLSDNGKLILNETGASLLKKSYNAMRKSFEELASGSNDSIVEEIEALKSQLKSPRCTECFKTTSLVWHPNKTEGEMCHLCYSKKHNLLKDDVEVPDLTTVDNSKFDALTFN